jgi:hypothetical protein
MYAYCRRLAHRPARRRGIRAFDGGGSMATLADPCAAPAWTPAVRQLGTRQRTVAIMVGLLRGPALLSIAGMAALLVLGEFATSATAVRNDAVYQRTALEYLQLPALVLGAGLLGIALARWLPWPGALPIATLVLYLGTIAMYQYTASDVVHGRTWLVLWPVRIAGQQGELPRQPLGQEMWHLAYLLGLGVLAGIAALLRVGVHRRALCAAAVVVAALAAVAAWLQLG